MEPIKQNCNVPRGQQKDNISFWSRKKYFSSPMNAERLDVILPIVGSNINEQIWVKVKVSRNVPRGQVFLLSTETLEGDKIGCIYSVMIKMATTTNVQETTEDRRRQKYRKNNPKLVQLSNIRHITPLADLLFIFQLMLTHFCWIIEYVMGPGPLGTMCINHYFWHDMATLIFGEDAFSVLDILDSVSITVGG